MTVTYDRRPVWLLDVDGVINVTRPGWGMPPRKATLAPDGQVYVMRWAPLLLQRLKALRESEAVEIRWCTTWCPWAYMLESLWGLPKLERALRDPAHAVSWYAKDQLKTNAARAVLAEGRRLVWTDDEAVPVFGPLYDELTAGGQALLIRPKPRCGLQPEDMTTIERFCKGEAL